MNLSEHFTLEELTYSDTANKYHVSNLPTENHLKTLKHTCDYFLEPLRALLNKRFVNGIYLGQKIKKVIIKITSGYRSKVVNSLLKKEGYHPSETSQHCTGEAVDIETVLIAENNVRLILPYNQLFDIIKSWCKSTNQLSVDQCIQEKQGNAVWVHCSYSAWGKTKNRNDFRKLTY